ncbi:Uncharacterised protein [uncultured archaeon]|nr:Uncharacterised protein [uncultured archaeon]
MVFPLGSTASIPSSVVSSSADSSALLILSSFSIPFCFVMSRTIPATAIIFPLSSLIGFRMVLLYNSAPLVLIFSSMDLLLPVLNTSSILVANCSAVFVGSDMSNIDLPINSLGDFPEMDAAASFMDRNMQFLSSTNIWSVAFSTSERNFASLSFSSSSILLRAVTSLAMVVAPTILPSSSLKGDMDSETSILLPPFASRTVS